MRENGVQHRMPGRHRAIAARRRRPRSGRGTEEKDFPPSATSRSSRLNAVVRGEGRAATSWEQPGWRVAVIWDKQEYVQLSYRLQDPTQSGSSGSEGL
jgi:hypothetical protein